MKVVLSSTNKAKTEAVVTTFSKFYPNENMEFITLEVETGVSTTPVGDEEGIQGCLNRIEAAKKLETGDVFVGLEGIVNTNSYGTFLYGWAVVEFVDSGRVGIGASGQIKLPTKVVNLINPQTQLRDAVASVYSGELVEQMSLIGTEGVITHGKYTRKEEFETALTCALAYVINEEND